MGLSLYPVTKYRQLPFRDSGPSLYLGSMCHGRHLGPSLHPLITHQRIPAPHLSSQLVQNRGGNVGFCLMVPQSPVAPRTGSESGRDHEGHRKRVSKSIPSQVWWCMSLILTWHRLRQVDRHEFKASLVLHSEFGANWSYTVRPCLKANEPKMQAK